MTKEIVHALNEINLSLYELVHLAAKSNETLEDLDQTMKHGHFNTSVAIEEMAGAIHAELKQDVEERQSWSLNAAIRALVKHCQHIQDCEACIYYDQNKKPGGLIDIDKGCRIRAPFDWDIPQEDLT